MSLLTPYACSQKSCVGGVGGGDDERYDERYRLLRAVTPQLLAAIFKTEMEAEVMTGKLQAAGHNKKENAVTLALRHQALTLALRALCTHAHNSMN